MFGGGPQYISEYLKKSKSDNEILMKETFLGIKTILEKQNHSYHKPILLIIKNIRLIPVEILNDLIHLIGIYRGMPHFLNLNLILGVQNNNKDELHLRVSIQNCVKLTIKSFHFRSMKDIIFEIIQRLLLSKEIMI